MALRDTFAHVENLTYRLRAASTLLGVTDNTLRGYSDTAGIHIRRASDLQPDAPAIRIFDPETLFQLAQWRRQQGYLKSPKRGSGLKTAQHTIKDGQAKGLNDRQGMPVVVTIDVIKGGTGKTTTAVELSVHLQLNGLRCLLIDLDVQANATAMMGYEADFTAEEAQAYALSDRAIVRHTLANVLIPYLENRRSNSTHHSIPEEVIKKPFGEHGPHLIPADTYLSDVEQTIILERGPRELTIRTLLEDAAMGRIKGLDLSGYDVILFDCPPNVSFTSTAALAASDIVVAPVRLDAYSVKGLNKLVSEINALSKAYNLYPDLVILPTHYAPRLDRIGRMQAKLDHYKNALAPCVINASEEFPKSLDGYLPITLQKPTSNAAQEYRMFADFMYNKIVQMD